MNPEVRARLMSAARSSNHWHEVATHLRDGGGSPEQDPAWPLICAFEYDLTEPTEEARRDRWGAFAPLIEFEQGVHPTPLDATPEDWLLLWEANADPLEDAVVSARLHDLLWERRRGDRPDLHARSAFDAYCEIAGGDWDPLYRAEALIRALELARAVADVGRRERVTHLLIKAAEASLGSGREEPGVALRLIRALQSLPRGEQPPDVGGLLAEAMRRYGGDPWLAQTITEMEATRTSDEFERLRLFEEQVGRWRSAASEADGLVRLHHLQQALELARDRGLNDLAEELRIEIQSVGPEQLDLKTISASVQIPTERVELFVEGFIVPDDWQESLTIFGLYGPPSGNHVENLVRVDQLIAEHPLQFLFSKTVLGPENVVIRHISSEAEHREAELAHYEARGISIWAVWAAEILDRFATKYGRPLPEQLADFFSTEVVAPEVAERISRAFALYWTDEPDEGAHILAPRLEAVVRQLCRQLGLPVIREPRPPQPGGVRLLGELMRSLQGRIDESWRRYLANVLVEPLGLNLRNQISHALLEQARKQELALLLHVASFLRMVRVGESEEGKTLTH